MPVDSCLICFSFLYFLEAYFRQLKINVTGITSYTLSYDCYETVEHKYRPKRIYLKFRIRKGLENVGALSSVETNSALK